MKKRSYTILFAFCLVAGLGACASPERFGGSGALGSASGVGSADSTVGGLAPDSIGTSLLDGTATSAIGSAEYFRQTIGDRVLFAVDQTSLSTQAQGILRAQANWLLANPAFSAMIEGHADEQGTREYNLALGARRASEVRDFLVAQGVSPGRIQTVTFGKERPLKTCSTEACYAENRRAVTLIEIGSGR